MAARASTLLLLALAGCGGGIFIGFGDDFDDTLPSVSLATDVASAPRGGSVQLIAAASDSNGIDRVAFFRVDGGGSTQLGADGIAPYQWTAAVPVDAVGSVRFFARATDNFGNQADSGVVSVAVTP